jgi:TolA-binding protein
MIAGDDCRSELLVAARRGRLSDGGRLALDAHLAVCPSCRMSHDVSCDFDSAEAVDLHDGARIRALADRARLSLGGGAGIDSVGSVGRRGTRVRPPVRLRALGAAAALVVFCGSASAAVWWWRRPAPVRPSVAPRTFASALSVSTSVRPPQASLPLAVPVAQLRARPRLVPHATLAARASTAPSATSATSILQQATEARQRGDRARAAELYRRLQREFPLSAEAALSAIPLGGLLLGDGLSRAALAQFDDYLGRAHGGALIPEALYGRARALARLGDRTEERRTWTRLCADFPDSAYAPLGRHRLAELE